MLEDDPHMNWPLVAKELRNGERGRKKNSSRWGKEGRYIKSTPRRLHAEFDVTFILYAKWSCVPRISKHTMIIHPTLIDVYQQSVYSCVGCMLYAVVYLTVTWEASGLSRCQPVQSLDVCRLRWLWQVSIQQIQQIQQQQGGSSAVKGQIQC